MQNISSVSLLFLELASYIVSPVLQQQGSKTTMGNTASEDANVFTEDRGLPEVDSQTSNGKVKKMSQLQLLEELYNQRIKIDEDEQKKYQGLLKFVVDTMINKMKESTPEFKDLYRETYY